MNRQIPFINLQEQYQELKEHINKEIFDVLNSSSYILGKKVQDLENELSKYIGREYCVSCSSGTDALFLILKAIGVGPGDEVIVPAFTFFATAEVVNLLGATPVFSDILPGSFTMDPESMKKNISAKTKAVIPVSIFGQVFREKEILEICKSNNISVIEDGAQSFGAERNGKKSLSFGLAGCTSFFPAKPLGAYGDGGAIFLDNENTYNKLIGLRNHGQYERYFHSEIGINGRLDSIQAAVLLAKLRFYDDDIKKRQEIADLYYSGLKDVNGISLPVVEKNNLSVFAQFTLQISTSRDDFISFMKEKNVPTAIHYPLPIYKQPVYEYLECNSENFPITEKVCKEVISLPFSPHLSQADQEYIIESINEWSETI